MEITINRERVTEVLLLGNATLLITVAWLMIQLTTHGVTCSVELLPAPSPIHT